MDRLSAMKLGEEISKFAKTNFTMKQSYSIQKVGGEDKAVYQTIAPVVMSKEGMKYFDNYPVTTSKDHVFYILTYDKDLIGFATIVPHATVFSIRNVYLNSDRGPVMAFNNLINPILKDFEASEYDTASVYCKSENVSAFKEKGFKVTKDGKNWVQMHKVKNSK